MGALLEVIALDETDARSAEAGGADRLELVGSMEHGGLGPSPALIERVRAATSLPIRAMIRVRDGFGAEPSESPALRRAVREAIAAGADGLVLGFLTSGGAIDVAMVTDLVGEGDFPWTFHRAIEHAASADDAWSSLATLPRLDQVLTAGSPEGVGSGLALLRERLARDPFARQRIMAGGGLAPGHVPTLRAAGIRAFHVGSPVREDRSFARAVNADLVARWRTLIDQTSGTV